MKRTHAETVNGCWHFKDKRFKVTIPNNEGSLWEKQEGLNSTVTTVLMHLIPHFCGKILQNTATVKFTGTKQ